MPALCSLPWPALLLLALLPTTSCNLVSFTLRYTADPAPLVLGSRVYLYTTHDATNQSGYTMRDYSLIISTDLLNWLDHGLVFDARSVTWGERGAWAQQTIGPITGSDGHGGTCEGCFYMYWPNVVTSSRNGSVGVALAKDATGPFVDVTPGGIPLMPGDDPTVHQDPATGAVHLCSNHYFTPICGRLAPDLLTWELPPRNISGLPHFFEAPWLMQPPPSSAAPSSAAAQPPPAYLMSYECPSRLEPANSTFPLGHYGQDICQAACWGSACPLEGWAFLPEEVLMWAPPLGAGNNHGGLFQLAGRWYYAYHTGALAASRGIHALSLQRSVAVDAAYPTPSTQGSAFLPVTATPSWLQQLAWVDPYAQGGVPGALTAGASEGVDTRPAPAGAGQPRVTALPQGGWLRVAGVDFGAAASPAQVVLLTVRGAAEGGQAATVAFSLDTLTAAPIATCQLSAAWATVACSSAGAAVSGVHDVFLAASQGSLAVEWWGAAAAGGRAASPPPAPPAIACASVRARGTGLLLSAPLAPADPVTASAAHLGPSTAWALVDNADGSWALQAVALGTYLCVPLAGGGAATAAAGSAGQPCARLYLQPTNDAASTATYAIYPGTAELGRGLVVLQADAASRTLGRGATDPRLASNDSARFDFDCTAARY
jgi:arabinoxylan arabinofuranohydrolase